MTLRILVVCEAPADFRTAADLADRVLRERVDWLDEALLSSVRQWWELDSDHSFILWRDIPKVAAARGLRLRLRSRFSGEPGVADAAMGELALLLAASMAKEEGLVGVLMIRDSDGDKERQLGLTQARTRELGAKPWPFRVVIGLAQPKREAWVLAGFEPQDGAEHGRLDELKQELGRDPCMYSHEFEARTHGSKRELKRILERLTAANAAREAICWQETPLDRLRQRGQQNGLAAYLTEIDEHIVPLLAPR